MKCKEERSATRRCLLNRGVGPVQPFISNVERPLFRR